MGWTDDVIDFAQHRFAYLDLFTLDKDNTSTSTVHKLPKPSKSDSARKNDAVVVKPKPKSKPKPKATPDLDSITTPALPPPKPKPKPKKVSPPPSEREAASKSKQLKTTSKDVTKPQPSKVAIDSVTQATKPQTSAMVVKEQRKDIPAEVVQKYEKIKQEMVALTDTESSEEPVTPKTVAKPALSEIEQYKAEIVALKQRLTKQSVSIEELERELGEKSEFIVANLKKLKAGRRAYDEVSQIFEEMRVEFQEQMLSQMEQMENERKSRLDKLGQFSVDIRVLEKIMSWYDTNNQFFFNLAELNNVIHKFEDKLNNGLAYDSELQSIVDRVPKSFLSHRLLTDLIGIQEQQHTFHINSHQQLHDRFCVLERALRQTSMTPKSSDSLWGNLLAKLFSAVLMREQISRNGTSLNDRISRAGHSMKCGDLQSALNELQYLDEDVLYPAQDWLQCARQRLLGLSAVTLLKSELLSRSIRMVDNDL